MRLYHGEPISLQLGEESKISPSFRINTIQRYQIMHLKRPRCNRIYCQCQRFIFQTTTPNAVSQSEHVMLFPLCVQPAVNDRTNHPCQAFNQFSCSESHSHGLPLRQDHSRSVQKIPVIVLLNCIQVRTDALVVRTNTCLKIPEIARKHLQWYEGYLVFWSRTLQKYFRTSLSVDAFSCPLQ